MAYFRWLLCFSILALGSPVPQAPNDLVEKSETIDALLHTGRFDEAEPLVRACLEQAPEEISFLSQLDMVLNGQGKYREADELRDRIRRLWDQKYKGKWIAKGYPVSESSWARMIATSNGYHVIGAEYFLPRLLEGSSMEDSLALIGFYKVIAVPRQGDGPTRRFELDKNMNERNYFLEEYAQNGAIIMAASYAKKPDIRAVVRDAVAYLDRGKK